jgi:biofilm PGA synthesis N-glycosyltransferase PgaC
VARTFPDFVAQALVPAVSTRQTESLRHDGSPNGHRDSFRGVEPPVTAQLIFWISLAVPVYAYLGYPVTLFLLRKLFARTVRKGPCEPSVTLLIAAYNEAAVIARKVRNSLALDYPPERIEILVASDGSTDATAEIVEGLADGRRVRLLAFPENRGKTATLNDAIGRLQSDVIVFSDAASTLAPDSVRLLVANFADPEVGAASGRYILARHDSATIGRSEDFYWRYETWLKEQESRLGSTLGAHGHLYAIRRNLYPFPPPGTINDDYVIPLAILAKGYRVVYEPAAVGFEEAHEMTGFARRVRIMAGNVQQLRYIAKVLRPFQPFPLFFFLSRKAIRLVVPFAMPAAFVANLFLLRSPLFLALFFLQAAFYALAVLGIAWKPRVKLLLLPFYFCMINLAAFFGFYHALTSRRRMAWK